MDVRKIPITSKLGDLVSPKNVTKENFDTIEPESAKLLYRRGNKLVQV